MNKSEKYKLDSIQGPQTWIDLTIYNGKKYPVRVVESNDGEVLVASDELLDDIHPGDWNDENEGFDSTNPEEAEKVYDEIFFFTDNTTFHYNDEDLRADMAEENPDFF